MIDRINLVNEGMSDPPWESEPTPKGQYCRVEDVEELELDYMDLSQMLNDVLCKLETALGEYDVVEELSEANSYLEKARRYFNER